MSWFSRCSSTNMIPETCGITPTHLLEAPVLPKCSLLCRLITSPPDGIPLHTTSHVMSIETVPHLPHTVTAKSCASCKLCTTRSKTQSLRPAQHVLQATACRTAPPQESTGFRTCRTTWTAAPVQRDEFAAALIRPRLRCTPAPKPRPQNCPAKGDEHSCERCLGAQLCCLARRTKSS